MKTSAEHCRIQDDIALAAAAVARDFDARQLPMLARLVRMPSDNPPGDTAPHAELTAQLLEELGFVVERHPVPAHVVEAAGMISATNLVVRRHFGSGGPTIALNAHGDVVEPGEGWSVDPYGAEIIDGVMYGRGVAVSKCDITTYAFAMLALETCQEHLRGTVELHVTYDEETGGSTGPGWLLASEITAPDVVICAGGTYFVAVAHAGCLHMEVEVAGLSAHAAWPETGVDALEATTAILAALYRERETYQTSSAIPGLGTPKLVIGTITGGIAANVVPDRVTFRLDRRILPEEDMAVVEASLRDVINDASAAIPGCRVEMRTVLQAQPLVPGPAQRPVIEALQRQAARVLGEQIPAVGLPLFTDARLYSSAGHATVLYGAGPRVFQDANGHRADERLAISDLRAATDIVAGALIEMLGVGAP